MIVKPSHNLHAKTLNIVKGGETMKFQEGYQNIDDFFPPLEGDIKGGKIMPKYDKMIKEEIIQFILECSDYVSCSSCPVYKERYQNTSLTKPKNCTHCSIGYLCSPLETIERFKTIKDSDHLKRTLLDFARTCYKLSEKEIEEYKMNPIKMADAYNDYLLEEIEVKNEKD